eukprot:m.124539 g.124539  ORF g.124539 m.124539 type:complete len:98 (-) comp52185_c0_seq3:94-387(-)
MSTLVTLFESVKGSDWEVPDNLKRQEARSSAWSASKPHIDPPVVPAAGISETYFSAAGTALRREGDTFEPRVGKPVGASSAIEFRLQARGRDAPPSH